MASKPEPSRSKPPARRSQQARIVVAGGLGGLVVVFGVLNLDEVDVNWIFGTFSTPLTVVIVVCLLLGMAIDRAIVHRGRRS